jgi:hypothetical protein
VNQLLVTVGSLEFHGQRSTSQQGYDFFIAPDGGFTGWDDGVDIRRERVDRPGTHGSFVVPGYSDSREVSISGWCRARSVAELAVMRDHLTGLLADGGEADVTVDNQGLQLYAQAQLGSKPKFESDRRDRRFAAYQLQLWFPNPRKYAAARPAEPVAIDVAVKTVNYGNFPAAPVFTITGNMPSGYTIAGPDGKFYVVSRPVLPGQTHVIDMATGWLRIDGVIAYGAISSGATWCVPANDSARHTLLGNGIAAFTVEVKDTYI